MRLGIFGGTFDPVHHGHLILARAAREELGLDRVVFIPAGQSPHKTDHKPATAQDRLAMLQLALTGEDGFEVDDLELHRPPPSYTVETLRHLASSRPNDEIILLLGADNVANFETWREPDEIRRLSQIALLDRTNHAIPDNHPVVRRSIDISSTDIRNRISAGRSIRYLTPDSVCDYIRSKGLYCSA